MTGANGTAVVEHEVMQEAMLKVIATVIETGVVTDDELGDVVGDKKLCARVAKTLKDKKFITKSDGGPDFDGATIWTLQNPDLYRGKNPLTIYLEVAGKETEREDVYKNYQVTDLHIQLFTPSLGGTPTSKPEFVDHRRAGDLIWLQEGHFRACMRDASRLASGLSQKSKQAIKNKWVYIADVFLPVSVLTKERVSCPAPQGKGITRHEAIAAGTIIDFAVKHPDILSVADVRNVWIQASQWIGFSPAKHNQGWGRFRVLE